MEGAATQVVFGLCWKMIIRRGHLFLACPIICSLSKQCPGAQSFKHLMALLSFCVITLRYIHVLLSDTSSGSSISYNTAHSSSVGTTRELQFI